MRDRDWPDYEPCQPFARVELLRAKIANPATSGTERVLLLGQLRRAELEAERHEREIFGRRERRQRRGQK